MNKLLKLASWETFLAVLAISTLLYASLFVNHFATSFNLSQAIAGLSEKALLVLPMVLLIIAREIDLSVASILALTSVVLGILIRMDVPLYACIASVLVLGMAAGAMNGILVTRLKLPSLVVTLGTMALFRGIGYIVLGSGSVSELPESLTNFGIDLVPGTAIPWTIVPFLVLAPIFAVILQYTPTGRRIYAIGGSPDAALYSGIKVQKVRFWLFVVSGLLCAIAGIVLMARLSNARANNAFGFELDVITIALLGGINVFGGKGKLTGVLWALVLIATLRNVLGINQVGGDAQGVVIGLLLIFSLLLNNGVEKLLDIVRKKRLVDKSGVRGSESTNGEYISGPVKDSGRSTMQILKGDSK